MLNNATATQTNATNSYKLERKGKTAWVLLRDEYKPGQLVRWGSGARWTVVEVRNEEVAR